MSTPTLSRTPSPAPGVDANTVPENATRPASGNDADAIPESASCTSDSPPPMADNQKSALWLSFERVVQGRNLPSLKILSTLSARPKALRQMRDTADYWVNGKDEPVMLRFPAKIDRNGMFERISSYFNLPRGNVSRHCHRHVTQQG